MTPLSPMGSLRIVRVDQVALVLHHRGSATGCLTPSRIEGSIPLRRAERLEVRVVDVEPGHGRRHAEEVGVVRRPLADPVLLERALVPVHAYGELIAAAGRSAVTDHPHVPDLVADLAHPRPVVGLVAPQVGERRDQDVAGVRVSRVAVGLAHLAAVADVVAGDAVLVRERAGADGGVRAGGHRGERTGDGVAVVGALPHEPLEVRPAIGPVLQHVPPAAVDHERDDDLRWRGPGGRADPRQHRPLAIGRPAREAHHRGGGRGEVGERDTRRVVGGLDATRRVHHQRDTLKVHPHRRMAGRAVEADEIAGLRGVVRAVVRREHQLELPGPAGMVGAADQLHVLGSEVARHRVLDRTGVGQRERARGTSERTAGEEPREAPEPREREEPAPSRVGGSVLRPGPRAPHEHGHADREAHEAGGQRELRAAQGGHRERDGAAEQREEDQRTR